MNVNDEAKKVIWSLQNNKRSEKERNVFAPIGKKAYNKNVMYGVSAVGISLSLSFILSQFTTKSTDFCFLLETYCYNSIEHSMAYTFYIFINLWILILGIGIAYLIGKKLGNRFKL
ncbi:hypothetical protein [Flavobacterium sp.]|jgi:hypothetical protein|uniref:hypothetical protein n=1 Tax=Flavobacterium sp. TaxID=239 RepID=UPI0037C1434D